MSLNVCAALSPCIYAKTSLQTVNRVSTGASRLASSPSQVLSFLCEVLSQYKQVASKSQVPN